MEREEWWAHSPDLSHPALPLDHPNEPRREAHHPDHRAPAVRLPRAHAALLVGFRRGQAPPRARACHHGLERGPDGDDGRGEWLVEWGGGEGRHCAKGTQGGQARESTAKAMRPPTPRPPPMRAAQLMLTFFMYHVSKDMMGQGNQVCGWVYEGDTGAWPGVRRPPQPSGAPVRPPRPPPHPRLPHTSSTPRCLPGTQPRRWG